MLTNQTPDAREDFTRGRTATATATGWKATRYFTVAYATDEAGAMSAAGIPHINDAHPLTPRLIVSAVKAQSVSVNFWTVQVDYTQPGGPQQDNTNPLSQPIKIKFQGGNQSQKIDQDIFGNPILNTAGGKFSSFASREFGTLFFTITRNEPFFNLRQAVQFQNTVNSTVFAPPGVPALLPGQCCCRLIAPTQEYVPRAAKYVTVQYTFEPRAGLQPTPDPDGLYDGFKAVLLNQGKSGWYNDTAETNNTNPNGQPALGHFCDKYGNRLQDDVLLDNSGVPMTNAVQPGAVQVLQQEAGGKANGKPAIRGPYRTPAGVTVRPSDPAGLTGWMLKYNVYRVANFNVFNFR